MNKIIKKELKIEKIIKRPGALIGTDPQLNDLGLEKDLQSNQYVEKPVPPSAQAKIDKNIKEVKKILDKKFAELKKKYEELDVLKRLEKNDLNTEKIEKLENEIKDLEKYMIDLNSKIDN